MKTVKLLKEMTKVELQKLPVRQAELRKTVYKRSGNADFGLTVLIAQDFNYRIKLGEAMYGSIKTVRNLKNDNQRIGVYLRISKGENPATGHNYYFMEVLITDKLVLRELLTYERIRQIELMIENDSWPKDLVIGNYPEKVEELQTAILSSDQETK